MDQSKFVTAINCMDGRTQLPVIEFMKKRYAADYVDSITEPGPIKILAENRDINILESVRKRLTISVEKHGSDILALVGHFDCAGNPVDKEDQLKQLEKAKATIEAWGFNVEIVKLWVDENWQVHIV